MLESKIIEYTGRHGVEFDIKIQILNPGDLVSFL